MIKNERWQKKKIVILDFIKTKIFFDTIKKIKRQPTELMNYLEILKIIGCFY